MDKSGRIFHTLDAVPSHSELETKSTNRSQRKLSIGIIISSFTTELMRKRARLLGMAYNRPSPRTPEPIGLKCDPLRLGSCGLGLAWPHFRLCPVYNWIDSSAENLEPHRYSVIVRRYPRLMSSLEFYPPNDKNHCHCILTLLKIV